MTSVTHSSIRYRVCTQTLTSSIHSEHKAWSMKYCWQKKKKKEKPELGQFRFFSGFLLLAKLTHIKIIKLNKSNLQTTKKLFNFSCLNHPHFAQVKQKQKPVKLQLNCTT